MRELTAEQALALVARFEREREAATVRAELAEVDRDRAYRKGYRAGYATGRRAAIVDCQALLDAPSGWDWGSDGR